MWPDGDPFRHSTFSLIFPSNELLPLAVGLPVKRNGASDWLKPVSGPLYINRPSASRWTEISVLGLEATRMVYWRPGLPRHRPTVAI